MFSRSHGSKNSGGGALTSHLFNRRRPAKPTSSSRATADNLLRCQSVGSAAATATDAAAAAGPGTPSGGRRHDVANYNEEEEDPTSPVQLVLSVRGNAERQETASSPPTGVARRTKLGLSVAVVRGPTTTMNNGSDAPTATTSSSTSTVVADDRRQLCAATDNRRDDSRSSQSPVSVASAPAVGDVQTLKDTGE